MSEQRTHELPPAGCPRRRRTRRRSARRRSASRSVRGGGAPAAACSRRWPLIGAKLKAILLLLPKLKLLTTSGSMLVSVAAYALIWGWKFAVGFVVLLFIHEMGHVIAAAPRGRRGQRAGLHPLPGRGRVGEVAGRQRAGRGARRPRRPDPRHDRRRRVPADRRRHRQRPVEGAGLHRLLPEPLQPAAGDAARRRPRDGRAGAVDVVRRASARSSCWPSPSPTRSSSSSRWSAPSTSTGAGRGARRGGDEAARLLRRAPPRPRARRARLPRRSSRCSWSAWTPRTCSARSPRRAPGRARKTGERARKPACR